MPSEFIGKIIEVMTQVKITGESVKFIGPTSILPQELIKWAYYLNLYKTDLHFITFHFVCYSQFDTLNSKFKSNHANKQITICGWKLCPLKVFNDFRAGFKVHFVCFCRQENYVLKWKCIKWDSVNDFPVKLMLNSSILRHAFKFETALSCILSNTDTLHWNCPHHPPPGI